MRGFIKGLMLGLVLLAGGTASAATRREACREYAQLDKALRSLSELPPGAPVPELKQAERNVAVSFRRFSEAAMPYAGPQMGDLKRSIHELDEATQNIPPNASRVEAHALIARDVTNVQIAKNGVLQSLGCTEMR